MALAGKPGRRTGVPTAELVADDARRRGRGVQPPEACSGTAGIRADDRADQHVQHTERHIGRTPPAAGRRRPGRQLYATAAAQRQLPGAARAQAGAGRTARGRRPPSAEPLLHERGLAAHVQRDHVQLPDTTSTAVHFRHQLPGAHQRSAVQSGERRMVSHPSSGAFLARRPGPVSVGLLGNEFLQ